MIQWMDVMDAVQVASTAAAGWTRGSILPVARRVADRLPSRDEWIPELTRAARRFGQALRESQREEKVALLSVMVVLAVLAWP